MQNAVTLTLETAAKISNDKILNTCISCLNANVYQLFDNPSISTTMVSDIPQKEAYGPFHSPYSKILTQTQLKYKLLPLWQLHFIQESGMHYINSD